MYAASGKGITLNSVAFCVEDSCALGRVEPLANQLLESVVQSASRCGFLLFERPHFASEGIDGLELVSDGDVLAWGVLHAAKNFPATACAITSFQILFHQSPVRW